MTELEILLGAIDDTIIAWEPEDAARHIIELLRRNLTDRMREAGPGARASQEEDPF